MVNALKNTFVLLMMAIIIGLVANALVLEAMQQWWVLMVSAVWPMGVVLLAINYKIWNSGEFKEGKVRETNDTVNWFIKHIGVRASTLLYFAIEFGYVFFFSPFSPGILITLGVTWGYCLQNDSRVYRRMMRKRKENGKNLGDRLREFSES